MTVHRSSAALLLATLCALGWPAAQAETQRSPSIPQKAPAMPPQTLPLLASLISLNHQETSRRTVAVDKQRAQLTRYERKDGRNAGMGGEHVSTLVAADGTLQGFTNMALDLAGKPLPTPARTEAIARSFLQSHAPDLLPRMQINWIKPHDEPLQVQHAGRTETVALTGMKLKARNLANGRWFWVIVGSDEQAMVFERDIVWVSFPGHRQTEKWLHDSWLKTHNERAAQRL